jgi:poly(3-hydroxybutyrate) depolymerase
VYWSTPSGAVPASGFPVVVLFQGSLFGPATTWDVSVPKATPFGGFYQVALVAKLLDSGFSVVQPEAQGGLAWNTNTGQSYESTPDAVFVPQLLSEIENGTFGPADATRLYAAGISSGGYMTSRMAVSYPGMFRALAIQSGSYATCLGPFCAVPSTLPSDHPPTLFLHGGVDGTVPVATAQDYDSKLRASGIETRFVEDPTAGHEWLADAPDEVAGWFSVH